MGQNGVGFEGAMVDFPEPRHLNEREKYVIFEGGKQEGIEIGIERGIEKGKEEIAKKMLEKNYSPGTISELTGLSEEEIKALREE